MRRLHTGVVSALALSFGIATAADAQGLRGFRAEGQVGITSFHSEGNSKSKIGWGAAVGVDAYVANNFVLGLEGTYWDARPENHTVDGAGVAHRKMFQEWGLGLRAGAMVTPSTLIYGKVAYVRNEQRKEFVPFVNGNPALIGAATTPGYYYDHYHVGGIQWGAGIEQMFTDNIYVKAEGRYSDYKRNSHAVTGLIGVGLMFGAAAAEPAPPPPPPPPPPPATQTCPDGSVIPATDACPAPPPPPPPPPPAQRGERG